MCDYEILGFTAIASFGMIVSDDVWEKFGLDKFIFSDDHEEAHECVPEPPIEPHSKHREIRQHDCMWTGLCVSEKHNKLFSTYKDKSLPSRVIAAGKSLLISQSSCYLLHHQRQDHCSRNNKCLRARENLESDGDSRCSGTIYSASEFDTDYYQDAMTFEQKFSINENLIVCLSAPVSAVTGQCFRSSLKKVKANETDHSDNLNDTETDTNASNHSGVSNTLDDHSYYINHPNGIKKSDYMGVQTPSDSEEEIDVVSFEKPAVLSSLPTMVDHKILHTTVKTVLNDKPAPRPRGRPPNSSRKRPVQSQVQEQKPAKRVAVQRSCQKKIMNAQKNVSPSISMPVKTEKPSVSPAFEEEPDYDKRNLHNNMERQRRIELREAFDTLRRLVPELKIKEKAPKVAILRQGGKYCMKIKEIEDELIAKKEDLKKQQSDLRLRLSFLRKFLALTR